MTPSNTVTSHAKKLKQKPYGVFLNLNKRNIKKLYSYKTVVIDAQFFSKKEIRKLKKHKIKVYSYINIGSLEKFRPYYNKFKNLTLGRYENWDKAFPAFLWTIAMYIITIPEKTSILD